MRTKAGRSLRFWNVWNTGFFLAGIFGAYLLTQKYLTVIAAWPLWILSLLPLLIFGSGWSPAGWLLVPPITAVIGLLISAPLRLAIQTEGLQALLTELALRGIPNLWLITGCLLLAAYSALSAWNRMRQSLGKPRLSSVRFDDRAGWLRLIIIFAGTFLLQYLFTRILQY